MKEGKLMIRKIVIFGASGGAKKVSQTLENLGYFIEFFVDNDTNKWGRELENKLICNPALLLNSSITYSIVIASEYLKDIEKQLAEMGLLGNVILREELIMEYIENHINEFEHLMRKERHLNSTESIIIDLVEGIAMGGIETWSFVIAEELANHNKNVLIYSKRTIEEPPSIIESFVEYFNLEYTNYWESIHELVGALLTKLPCTVIINRNTQMLFAAYIIKCYFPNQIKIISVIHSDFLPMYRRQKFLEVQTDAVLCVSQTIKMKLHKEYGIPGNKLFYKESPVNFEKDYEKEYAMDDKPIRIGYAGRLQKSLKRADLLILLIKKLELEHINYILSIAGDGELFDTLKNVVVKEKCENRVKVLGRINKEKMTNFWKKTDVFISLSETEGLALSMLEAMSFGAVPVVTCVSGVEEFIDTGVNGYVSDIGDIDSLVKYISMLDKNREKLSLLGSKSKEIIKHRCNREEYIDYILKMVDSITKE